MAGLDYSAAALALDKALGESEVPHDPLVPEIATPLGVLFAASTQAFREALVGCALARLLDQTLDVTKPYVKHGDHAYNGRTLDEKVVNPLLRDKRIPVSRAPFLSTLRRGIRFDQSMAVGVRDQKALAAFLTVVNELNISDQDRAWATLLDLCRHFIALRNASEIPLTKLNRISRDQYGALIDDLLATPSGGRIPVMLVDATFNAINEAFSLGWKVVVQGINVADGASGAGGDVEVIANDKIVVAVEVTERPVDKHRVQATFQTKIAPHGIDDYLFVVTTPADDEAVAQARQYFSQGHEVNFVNLRDWLLTVLVSIGSIGRNRFNQTLIERLSAQDTPAALKLAWNAAVAKLTAI